MKTSEDFEREFIADCEGQTGKSLATWMDLLKATGLTKQKELLGHVKAEYGLNHMQSNFLAGIYLNGGKPVFDTAALFNAHFEKYPHQREIYDALEAIVKAHVPTVKVVGTKGYISFRNEKEFAVARINKGNVCIGMDLGDRPFDDVVQKAKSLGAMPRISHMVQVTTAGEVTEALAPLLVEANGRVN